MTKSTHINTQYESNKINN